MPAKKKGPSRTSSRKPKFRRVLLKISGEVLGGKTGGICPESVHDVAAQVREVASLGVQIGVVVGGGNIFRGLQGSEKGIERVTGDHMGMLATVINSMALQDALEKQNVPTRVQSAITMSQVAEPYIKRKAVRHLEKKRIVIFAAGTGNPFFSTDTAASLRASEMNCSLIIKATKVDGIYNKDPNKFKNAKLIKKINYNEVINSNLRVMDLTAISLAKESNIPIIITNIFKKNSLISALKEKGKYSKIS